MPFCSIINCTKPTLTTGLQVTSTQSCPVTSEVTYGSHCSFTCSRGYYIEGDQVLSCLSDGSWNQSAPTCHAVNCTSSDIPVPANGVKTGCSNAVETYGTVCSFFCNIGYLPDSPVYRTCDDDGTGSGVWDGGPVTCTIVMCTAFDNPRNGSISECLYGGVPQNITKEQKYGTVCSMHCNNGFTWTSGSASRMCTASGTWDGADTICEDITPPVLACPLDRDIVAEEGTVYGNVPWDEWEPLMATDGDLEIESNLVSIGSVPVTTSPTSLVEGAHQITYGVFDSAGNEQTCSFVVTTRVIRCPGLPVPEHGSIHLGSGGGDCVGGAVYGSSCVYGCDVGYQLFAGNGNFSRNCLRNNSIDLVGYWDADQPTCLIQNCTLPAVMNVHSPDCLTTAVGYGTNCEFECDRGYTTLIDVDHVNRSCQAESTWGGSDFNCSVVITCPAQLSLEFGRVIPPECSNSTDMKFDTECEYSCGSGFLLHGPSNIRCNPDGSWNDLRQPYCEDIQNPIFSAPCPVHVRVDAQRGTTYANVTLVQPEARDNSGNVNVSRIGPKDTIFHEGVTTVPYLASDASGNEARCDVIVTVTVYRCPTPKAPVEGFVTNCSKLFYGSACSFGCNIGYDLIGSETLTCDLTQGGMGPNATWNEHSPTCQIRTCVAVRLQPPAAKAGCDKNPPLTEDYDTVCTFTCPYGFRGIGDSRSRCDENGKWSSTNFTCERTPCSPLSAPSGMTITPSSCTTDPRYGDTCTLQCSRSGFEVYPQSSSSVTCSGNERWNKNILSTSCKDVEPPVFTQCPNDFVRHPGRSSTSAFVSWTVAATDNDAIGPTVSCDHPSNVSMPLGQHPVTCIAADRSGYTEDCSFIVTVEVRQCKPLVQPAFGALNGSCDTVYGSSCHVTCILGYHLNGSSSASCEFNGTDMYWMWDMEPHCQANWCPPVALPSMLAVYPDSCSLDARVAVGTVCTCYCTGGLSLVGNDTTVTCLIDGQWDRQIDAGAMTCKDKTPPVITFCPGVVNTVRTQYWGVEVTFDLPTAHDTVDPHLEIVTDPADLESPYNFTSNTACRYTFVDDSGNKATCVFDVDIKDLVEPTFVYCPPDQNITTSQQMTLVTWDEPIVQDIPGDDVLITCNYDTNQVTLPWGENEIVYKATNLNNAFQKECKFIIIIVPFPCTELHPPQHGALSCDTWLFSRYCSVSCDESFDIPRSSSLHQPTTLYVCGTSGLWTPHAYVADCSQTRDPRRSNLPSALQYYTGTCESPVTTEDIAEAFITILRGSMFREACDKENECLVENVAVWCGGAVARGMVKRSSEIQRRRKRNANQEIDKDLDSMRQKFQNNDMDKGGTTTVYLDIAIRNILDNSGLALEGKLLSMAREIKEQFRLLHNLTSLSLTTGYSVIQCEDGYIADHETLKCVACTTGYFYERATSGGQCTPCVYGYYQHQQAQVTCRKCPEGQSTEIKGSRSKSDCKDMCHKGQFSHSGLQPCVKCPRDTFQPMKGQASCFDCSGSSITLHTGSSSPDQCIDQL
ncbi:sushi, von Willebrand factor type A, EGF and pentraxin domain-containing protein 1 [Strongylocentrotus purpuratus]|uniref:Sushi, von Willebrand factor type A, EGF and pentraxin domain-containing protein 1-like n=1 Tax=Strongylocentrotus purpuratus TaxID=7668 RepID=A0A7M7HGQ9_STRPU|nr:sushi, von Willebrand factor type A, EGF and pentraxin domain-containing protein 1 [Strongylocentrotus purpuratus]